MQTPKLAKLLVSAFQVSAGNFLPSASPDLVTGTRLDRTALPEH